MIYSDCVEFEKLNEKKQQRRVFFIQEQLAQKSKSNYLTR